MLRRRDFLRLTTLAGTGLTLGVLLPQIGDARADTREGGAPLVTPFIHISPDNRVTVISKHLEMGQGIHTGVCAMVAEELDAAWGQMQVEDAPAQVPMYANLMMDPRGRLQVTGGSLSTADCWEQMRRAGAAVRAMLLRAAAEEWRVPMKEVTASDGALIHEKTARRATFGQMAARAAALEVPQDVPLKDPAQFKLIGRQNLHRVDTVPKSTGRERYGIDTILPGMMTAVVARSPRFGGRVRSFDASKALSMPGVVDVVEIPNGVAVVARSTWQALRGREALEVDWDDSRAEKRSSAQIMQEFKELAVGKRAVVVARKGNTEEAFARCAKTLTAGFELPYLAHAMMEPLNAVARLSATGCEVWTGAQFQTNDQMVAAQAADLPTEQVRIHTLNAGGSFGRRGNSEYVAEAVWIAKATGGKYPVRVMWTREDDIKVGRYRPLNYHRFRAGIDHKGALIALEQRIVGQSLLAGTLLEWMIQKGVDPTAVTGNVLEQYAIPNAEITWTRAELAIPVQFWRSVQHSHMAFSAEVIIDELADLAGQDPVAFRLSMLTSHPRQAQVLRLAAQLAGWGKPLQPRAGARRGRGVALHLTFGTVVAQVVEVTVENDSVLVDRVVCVVDCGIAVNPSVVEAQMESGIIYGLTAALHGKITLTDGKVDQGNFNDYPVLRMNAIPRMEIHVVPSSSPPSGVGEPGLPPIAPAVANAIRAATGTRIRRLPIDLAAVRHT